MQAHNLARVRCSPPRAELPRCGLDCRPRPREEAKLVGLPVEDVLAIRNHYGLIAVEKIFHAAIAQPHPKYPVWQVNAATGRTKVLAQFPNVPNVGPTGPPTKEAVPNS